MRWGGVEVRAAAVRACVIGVGLVACESAARADEILTTSFLPWVGTSGWNNARRACLDEFLDQHPGVLVKEFRPARLPPEFFVAADVLATAATAGPDVPGVPVGRLGDWVREGLLAPMDEFLSDHPARSRVWRPLLDELAIDGHVWGVGDGGWLYLLAADPEACRSAGIPESRPATWEELADCAIKLTSASRDGIALPDSYELSGIWAALAVQGGADLAVFDEGGRLAPDLTSSACVSAATVFAEFGARIRKGGGRIRFEWNVGALVGPLGEGKAAISIVTQGTLSSKIGKWSSLWQMRPNLWPIPGLTSSTPVSFADAEMRITAIPSYLPPARRRLVWEYATFATELNPAFEDRFLAQIERSGEPPLVSSMLLRPDHPIIKALPAHWAQTFRTIAAARALPPYGAFQELMRALGPPMKKIVTGEAAPVDALRDAQRSWDDRHRFLARRSSTGWRFAAWGGLAALALALAWGLFRLVRVLAEEARTLQRVPGARLPVGGIPVLLILFVPGLAFSVVFGAWPLLSGFVMSLTDHTLRDGGDWVGARHYLDVLRDPATHHAIGRTAVMIGWSFLLAFVGPLALALGLSGFRRLGGLARGLFFLPAVANAVVVGLLWEQALAPGGAVEWVVKWLGLTPRNWLGDPAFALPAVVVAQAWGQVGLSALAYLAGLAAVPEELYEACEMEGAGVVERFRAVVLPHLAPLIGVSFVGWLLTTTRAAEHVLLMTAGGPDGATRVLGLEIFSRAYVEIRFGYAMAEVWLLVAVILVLAIAQMRAIRAGQLKVAV